MSHDPEVMVGNLVNGNGVGEYAISSELLDAAVEEIQALVEQRDRARSLAAHLEEIVAMRTAVLEALVSWAGVHGCRSVIVEPTLVSIAEWAKAQLSEVP